MACHLHFLFVLEVLTIAKLDHQLNDEIRDKEVRLIGDDGAQLGIMSAERANELAEEQGLDLVKISPNATPQSVRSWTIPNSATIRKSGKRMPERIRRWWRSRRSA